MAVGPLFKRVCIIGVGLIGSSIARVIKARDLADGVVCYDKDATARRTAKALKIVDAAPSRLAQAVAGADLVFLCTPIGSYERTAKAIAPHLGEGAIVTDVGSVKAAAIKMVAPHLPEHVHFVPGHPVAGTEKSGPEAGFATLFDDRWCVLTPLKGGDRKALHRVVEFWLRAGSKVELMDPAHHDKVMAITSHLPHLIAYTIVGTATDFEDHLMAEVVKFAAGGFRDFTRIAGSDPVMWRDVFMNNREAVLEALGRFTEDLSALQRAIRWGEAAKLEDLFTRTREIRRGVIEAGQAGTFIPTESTDAKDAEED